MLPPFVLLLASLAAPASTTAPAEALRWHRLPLSDVFLSEAAVFGDLNGDGHTDVVAGPYAHLGPTFAERVELYPARPFDPLEYSDCFTLAVHDIDDDGWRDVLLVGFPGAEASWLRNPGPTTGTWRRTLVQNGVGNESPIAADLTGDGRLDLAAARNRQLGYASPSAGAAEATWNWHGVTPPGDYHAFTHGLGVGDIDGDGRADLVERRGWWRQPQDPQARWEFEAHDFGPGGAQMLVYDVNGDGHTDVITSLQAHGYGLSWFEQQRDAAGRRTFREHSILPADGERRQDGVQFSQPHALVLADLDGDGRQDIVTGKRWWAHGPSGDPEPNAPAVLYGFLLRRLADGGVRFAPVLIDDASGVGTQIDARDVNGDGRADIVTSNKRGTFLFLSQSP